MRAFSHLIVGGTVVLALVACSGGKPKEGQPGRSDQDRPAIVSASVISSHDFVDSLEAIGTAKARESVVLSSSVTDRIQSIPVRDGQYVRKGHILIELARSEEDADLRQARARAKEAESQLDRIQSLAKEGYATRARLDEQIAARDSARAQMASLEARVQDRFIRAPFSGMIGLRSISPGLVASANTPILEISDTSVIKLDFSLPETSLAAVRVGQTVQAIAAAYPDLRISGRIDAIDPQIDPVTRSATLRALIPNSGGKLKAGMLLTVKIEQARHIGLAVPEQALVAEGENKFVFKINTVAHTVEKVRVTTGLRDDDLVELTGGIAPGSTIVTDGTIKVRDGGKVSIAASVASTRP
jgi:membrane fusion protein, multidrug efflux system